LIKRKSFAKTCKAIQLQLCFRADSEHRNSSQLSQDLFDRNLLKTSKKRTISCFEISALEKWIISQRFSTMDLMYMYWLFQWAWHNTRKYYRIVCGTVERKMTLRETQTACLPPLRHLIFVQRLCPITDGNRNPFPARCVRV
jgi:hypothetical protein